MHVSALLPLALATLTHALSLHLTIPPSPLLPSPNTLPPSTTATLTTLSTIHRAPLRHDSTFAFRNVSTGSYLLDIHCATHAFAPLRVDVSSGGEVQVWGTFRGNEWENLGEEVGVLDIGGVKRCEVRVLAAKEYFFERSGFSPLSLLKNPMILIAGVSMAIVFGMPYLMDNMDPEMKAEFEERQKSSSITGGGAPNPLQNFDAAAWLAGSKKSEAVPVERGVTR